MAFRFEDLKVWHKAADLSNEIDRVAKTFTAEERFSLTTQIKKAADSVVLNIAEGSTGQTKETISQKKLIKNITVNMNIVQ